MRVNNTTPLLLVAAVLSIFSFPFTIHAASESASGSDSGSGSGSESSSVSGSSSEKPPMFLNFSPTINGQESAVLRLQKDSSRKTIKRLAGLTSFLAREVWTDRVDFSAMGGGIADDVDDTGESVDSENMKTGEAGEALHDYDIAKASFYGGPRDTPFRFCRLYGGSGWVNGAFGPGYVVSTKGAIGVECYAIYFHGISDAQSYPWLGTGY